MNCSSKRLKNGSAKVDPTPAPEDERIPAPPALVGVTRYVRCENGGSLIVLTATGMIRFQSRVVLTILCGKMR